MASQTGRRRTLPQRTAPHLPLQVDALYYVGDDDDRIAYSDGTHLNVMSYLYVGYKLHGAVGSEVDLVTGESLGRNERWYETDFVAAADL